MRRSSWPRRARLVPTRKAVDKIWFNGSATKRSPVSPQEQREDLVNATRAKCAPRGDDEDHAKTEFQNGGRYAPHKQAVDHRANH